MVIQAPSLFFRFTCTIRIFLLFVKILRHGYMECSGQGFALEPSLEADSEREGIEEGDDAMHDCTIGDQEPQYCITMTVMYHNQQDTFKTCRGNPHASESHVRKDIIFEIEK